MTGALKVGSTGEAVMMVGSSDTAIELGSGDVNVLGTPRLLALCEEATVVAVARLIDPERTTVGIEVHLDHLAASRIGDRVSARAELVEVDGSRLRFEVTATSNGETVGRGRVTRVLVDRSRFGP